MVQITEENIIRIHNGDVIVKGDPGEIEKRKYEDGWVVLDNFRDSQELEVEKTGHVNDLSPGVSVRRKLSYYEFIDGNWYRLSL